jgi:hypothetical protein
MQFQFGKQTARVCAEQVIGRLRQYVNDLPLDKMLTIDEFAERMTICFLNELTEINLPVDPQLIIAVALAMNHACMQLLAAEVPDQPNPSEIYCDDTVH